MRNPTEAELRIADRMCRELHDRSYAEMCENSPVTAALEMKRAMILVHRMRGPTEMEGRVAKAIELWELDDRMNGGLYDANSPPSAGYVGMARAAIRALRYATEDMVKAGLWGMTVTDAWKRMIDAASPGDETCP